MWILSFCFWSKKKYSRSWRVSNIFCPCGLLEMSTPPGKGEWVWFCIWQGRGEGAWSSGVTWGADSEPLPGPAHSLPRQRCTRRRAGRHPPWAPASLTGATGLFTQLCKVVGKSPDLDELFQPNSQHFPPICSRDCCPSEKVGSNPYGNRIQGLEYALVLLWILPFTSECDTEQSFAENNSN